MDTQKARVLVADDDESIRQLLCTIIRREGYEVECVGNGIEAIERLGRNEYAVILLDLMMPRLDGFGVIEYLKNHPRPAKPVVLVITAYADQKFKLVDSDIVAGVLRKPFEIAEVGSLIRLCVNGYDSELSQKLYVSQDKAIRHFVRDQISDRGHQNN
jgi:two-component system, OmpR family, response regulator